MCSWPVGQMEMTEHDGGSNTGGCGFTSIVLQTGGSIICLNILSVPVLMFALVLTKSI